MASGSSETPAERIGTGDIITAYPDDKTMLGRGSFGVVFATRKGNSRLAVKVIHCAKHWRQKMESLNTEVLPLVMSRSKAWKHVTWANKAFVHENFASDLLQLQKKTQRREPFSLADTSVLGITAG